MKKFIITFGFLNHMGMFGGAESYIDTYIQYGRPITNPTHWNILSVRFCYKNE